MKVKDIMTTELIICKPEDSIGSTAQLIKKSNISGLPIVNDEDELVGIVSEMDILKLLDIPEHGGLWLPSPFEVIEVPIRELISWEETKRMLTNIGSKQVKEIMKKEVHTTSPESSIEDASKMMTRHKINRLPVMEDDKLVGIISRGDIIRGLAEA